MPIRRREVGMVEEATLVRVPTKCSLREQAVRLTNPSVVPGDPMVSTCEFGMPNFLIIFPSLGLLDLI
jgi:hypothetical protein